MQELSGIHSFARPGWMQSGLRRLRSSLLLDASGEDPASAQSWQASVFIIMIASSMLLCLLFAVHSLLRAWALNIFAVIGIITAFYLALMVALKLAQRAPKLSAVALLGIVYGAGFVMLYGLSDAALSDLGMIILYGAPLIGWVYFGIRGAIGLMALNTLIFVVEMLSPRTLMPFGIDLLLPFSRSYLHGLLFLFFNVSMPLAMFRVFTVIRAGADRHRETIAKLRKSNALYQDMFEYAGGPALICDAGGQVLKANGKAQALFDRPLLSNGVEPVLLGELFESSVFGMRSEALLMLARNTGFAEAEFVAGTAGGGREMLIAVRALSARCLLVGLKDLSGIRTMQRELFAAQAARDRLISYDHLTNLPNRDYLGDKLRELMGRRVLEPDGTLLAVAGIRLNNIRSVNEKYGQGMGDEMIREFGRLLLAQSRSEVLPCRLRGVVFSLLITGCRSQDDLKTLLDEFVHTLPRQCVVGGKTIDFDIAVGAAFSRGGDISANELIHRSERALGAARKTASDVAVLFNEDIAREIHREINIEMALSGAITRREFSFVYQPKVGADRRIDGLEALLRWTSPELGVVSPAEFIPIAERTGRIHAITDYVIDAVCRQQRSWLDRHASSWPVAINLSGIDLQRADIAEVIIAAVLRQQLPPALLQLEITETGLIEDDDVARENLQRLTAAGFNIAIDDFGTGYSSLKKLSEYPVNTIKIDRSFVLAIGENPRSEQIIRLILALAKFLHCETVAEGVEAPGQLQFLLDNGCRRFQGYLFYKPQTTRGIDVLLSDRREPQR